MALCIIRKYKTESVLLMLPLFMSVICVSIAVQVINDT